MNQKLFNFPIIDFHVHLFPDRMFDAIWKAFRRDYNWEVVYQLYAPEAISFLRSRGVETLVYSNYAHKPGVADFMNQWNLELLDREDNLYCFAAFHPDDPDLQPRVARLLSHPRVLGFKLQLLVQRFFPDDERLFPLYERVIEAGKRILMHVGTGPVANEFVGVTPFRRLLQRYPKLKVNVPHMGGREYDPFLELLDEFPDLYLDTAFAFLPDHDASFPGGPAMLLRYQDRIVYGSDFPNLLFPWETEIQALKEMNLGEEFYRKVFRENGLKLIRESP